MTEPGDDAMAGHDMGAPSSGEQPPALAGAAGMPGMATAQDLDRLTRLEGRAAEVLYLKLMIAHHRGGVAMAEAVLERTDRPVVSRLAQIMVTSQTAEITAMQDMLDTRRGAP